MFHNQHTPVCYRYDFFKAELLKTKYFDDNIICHFTASFAAVGLRSATFSRKLTNSSATAWKGTVATTVCSPADVLKVCLSYGSSNQRH